MGFEPTTPSLGRKCSEVQAELRALELYLKPHENSLKHALYEGMGHEGDKDRNAKRIIKGKQLHYRSGECQ